MPNTTSRFQPPADFPTSFQVSLAPPGAASLVLTHSPCVLGPVPPPSHLCWVQPCPSATCPLEPASIRCHIGRGQDPGRSGFGSWGVRVRIPGDGPHAGARLCDAPCCPAPHDLKDHHQPMLLHLRRGVPRAPRTVGCEHHTVVCAEVAEAPDHGTQLESPGPGWDQTPFLVPPACSKCLGHMDWRP